MYEFFFLISNSIKKIIYHNHKLYDKMTILKTMNLNKIITYIINYYIYYKH
jgi:hypothetical protein